VESLHQFEIIITLFIQNFGVWLVPIMKVFTAMGYVEFYMLIIPMLYWCIETRLGLQIAIILLISSYLNVTVKLVFHTPRPYWIDQRVKAFTGESSFGMPSGHAQNAASVFGLATTFTNDRSLKYVFLICIFLIGFSRIDLGVHFTSDVIAGWLIGGLLLALYLRAHRSILNWFLSQKFYAQIFYTFLSSMIAILIAYLFDLSLINWKLPEVWAQNAKIAYPSITINPLSLSDVVTATGMWFGFISGAAYFNHKYGKFIMDGTFGQKLLRYIVGLAGIAALYLIFGTVFPKTETFISYAFRFICFALIGLWITDLAPLFFMKVNLARQQNKNLSVFDGK
jgi:membrane-associated phospholipid phosphatase